jgi:2,3-bisphosphoglycerate-dependent phosphoglycerate mutase
LQNRFTGWKDVELTEQGIEEARFAGRLLKDEKFKFDKVYSSYLRRALDTWHYLGKELDQQHLPLWKTWRLNERHYGGLTGLNKKETAEKYGDE